MFLVSYGRTSQESTQVIMQHPAVHHRVLIRKVNFQSHTRINFVVTIRDEVSYFFRYTADHQYRYDGFQKGPRGSHERRRIG